MNGPEPTDKVTPEHVRRVLLALVAIFEGRQLEMAVLALLTPSECAKLATRASAIEPPVVKAPSGAKKR